MCCFFLGGILEIGEFLLWTEIHLSGSQNSFSHYARPFFQHIYIYNVLYINNVYIYILYPRLLARFLNYHEAYHLTIHEFNFPQIRLKASRLTAVWTHDEQPVNMWQKQYDYSSWAHKAAVVERWQEYFESGKKRGQLSS